MFSITNHKGFQITFPNGWTVSVQWGPGNYCENRYIEDIHAPEKAYIYCSNDAEVAAWDSNGVWYDFGSDTVKGRCTPQEVAEFITRISSK